MDLLDFFKNESEVVTIGAGELLFREKHRGDMMYVVLEGEIEIRVREELIDLAQPGDVVGEMALIDTKKRSASAIARQNSKLVCLNEEKFLQMVKKEPHFALDVMRILAKRLRKMNKLFYG